jgi:hypothetical protein
VATASQLDLGLPPCLHGELAERIHKAHQACSLTARLVLDALEGRLGAASAMSIAEMQRQLACDGHGALSDRDIKAAVKELVEEGGVPVGSSRSKPFGYFLIVSDEDAEIAVRPLLGELKSIAGRIRKLSPKTDYVRHLLGQEVLP